MYNESDIVNLFQEIKKENNNLSLDELLYETYKRLNTEDSFENIRTIILKYNNINEYEYYTKDVKKELKEYIEKMYFLSMNLMIKLMGLFIF